MKTGISTEIIGLPPLLMVGEITIRVTDVRGVIVGR